MAEENLIEVRFRVTDGTDIGPNKYSPSITVATLKADVVEHWSRGKEHRPKKITDVKLIYAGKILENNKTLADLKLPVTDIPGGVITMHAVVPTPQSYKSSDKMQDEFSKKPRCSCSIL